MTDNNYSKIIDIGISALEEGLERVRRKGEVEGRIIYHRNHNPEHKLIANEELVKMIGLPSTKALTFGPGSPFTSIFENRGKLT